MTIPLKRLTGRPWPAVAVLAVALLVPTACTTSVSQSPSASSSPSTAPSPLGSPTAPSQRPSLPPPSEPAEGPLPLEIVEAGFTTFSDEGNDLASYAAVLRNPNDEWAVFRMELEIDFYDATDSFIAGEEVVVIVLPGQTTAIAGQAFGAGRTTRFEVNQPDDTAPFEPRPASSEGFEVADVTTARDATGSLTTGRLLSRFTTTQEFVELVAVFRDGTGALLGGSSTGVQSIDAGGEAPFEITDASPYREIDTTEVYWRVSR